MVQHISSSLRRKYPSTQIAINPDTSEWVFNNAGGAMGAMYIIHASITEYLIVFGTPLGTEGHTGIHTADDYFNILVGEQWAFSPPNLTMEVYPAGSVHHLKRGQLKQYKMHKGCFALEYARGEYPTRIFHPSSMELTGYDDVGWIPLMLPFGFADMFSSTLDYVSVYNTARITAREMLRNLLILKI